MAHRLDLVVHRLRRAEAQFLQRVAFEDVQHLADHHAARTRRRRRDHAVAAVVALDRRHLAGLVLIEVGLGDDALACHAGGHDGRADRALVEAFLALVADQFQRGGQVLLHQLLTRREGRAVVQEDRARRGVLLEVFGRGDEHVHVALVEHETVLRVPDRRRDQRGTLHRAVFRERQFHAGDGARHAHREVAVRARALDDVAVLVEVHVRRGGERRFFAEVEKGLAPVGELDRHEAPTTEVAGCGVDHCERVAHGDRGIDCVAAVFQHVDTDLGGEVLGADDHAVFGGHRCL